MQLIALGVTLGIAMIGGAITGITYLSFLLSTKLHLKVISI